MENRLPQCFQSPDTKPPSWSRQQHSKQNKVKTNILLHSSEIAVHRGNVLNAHLKQMAAVYSTYNSLSLNRFDERMLSKSIIPNSCGEKEKGDLDVTEFQNTISQAAF